MPKKKKLSRETYLITAAWLDSAVADLRQRVGRGEIDRTTFAPVAAELARVRDQWYREQEEAGNVR